MGQYLSAGVFIEELPSTSNIVSGVSTSNMGIVGWTPQGPTNEATYVTSFPNFVSTFGSFDSRSLVAYAMAAFFYNGGSTSYVVRVTPTDAETASATVQGVHTNQLIEQQAGYGTSKTVFSETGGSSGTTPLFIGNGTNKGSASFAVGSGAGTNPTFSIKYRQLTTAVTDAVATQRDQFTPLVGVTDQTAYEGSICPTPSALVATETSPNFLLFQAVDPTATDVSVKIVIPSSTTSLSASVSGNAVTITAGYSSGVTTTAKELVEFLETPAGAAAGAIVTASYTLATDLLAAVSTTDLVGGLPTYDETLDALQFGSLTVTWTSGSIVMPVCSSSVPYSAIQTYTDTDKNVCTIDHRSGRFSLVIGRSAPTAGTPIEVSYSPFAATSTLVADTTVTASGYVGIIGTPLSSGGTTTAQIAAETDELPVVGQSWLKVNSTGTVAGVGAYSLTFTTAPSQTTRLVATYTTNDWTVQPISAGVWGDAISIQVQGSPNYFTTATQSYSRYITYILTTTTNTTTGATTTSVTESYEDDVWTSETDPNFFGNIVNEFSSVVEVTTPGADEGPPQLNGISNTQVIGGGDGTTIGQAFSSVTLVGTPVAPFAVTIQYQYWDASLSTPAVVTGTITDDGDGNLVGSVDTSYTLGNTIDYASGAVTFKTANPIYEGTLVVAGYYTSPAVTSYTVPCSGGSDGTFDSTHFGEAQYTSSDLAADYQGLYALDRIEDLMQVVVPDFAGVTTVVDDLLDYAALHASSPSGGDRFIVLSTPQGLTAQKAVNWFRNTLGRYSDYAALYWPWINITDPLTTLTKTIPGDGHVCGVYARTDANRNVGKSPGGTVDGQLAFIQSLEYAPTLGDRNLVYPNKINPFISSPQTGMAVWGVRTISNDPQWMYINARRLFMFLEKSIYNSTFWVVFENNGSALWAKIKSQITGFLNNLFSSGYLAGTSPSQAFFVICDSTNNTQDTINAGQVVCTIGAAPNKPSEFAVFQFSQITNG